MMPETFEKRDLAQAVFHDVSLADARFDDVNMQRVTFHNINLTGAQFSDINFSHVSIMESCIEGLTVWGWDVQALIRAEEARQKEAK